MHRSTRLGIVLVLLSASACDPPDTVVRDDTPKSTSEPLFGNVSACNGGAGFWPGDPPLVPVCFENPTDADAGNRNWIQSAVQGSWQRFGRVNFTGWGACGPSDSGIRIQLTTSTGGFTPITPPGRCTLDGVKNGMQLNPTSSPQNAAASLAMHEFGHALGFYHEEERPEAAETCTPACDPVNELCVNHACIACPGSHNFGPTVSTQREYGQYDYDSIMSYCGQQVLNFVDNCGTCTNAWKLRPGANDIASLQSAYGRRTAGQLVTSGGNCLALGTFTPGTTGATPFLWTCDEFQDDQYWRFNNNQGTLKIDTTGTGTGTPGCLWADNDVEVRDCDGSINEIWRFTNVELRGWGNKCLDLQNGDTTPGTPVQLFDCFSDRVPPSNNANQRWTLQALDSAPADEFQIVSTIDDTSCVAVSNNGAFANGTPLVIAPCATSSSIFHFDGAGHLAYSGGGSSDLCWDASGVNTSQYVSGQGGPYDTAPIALFTCGDALNQKWNLSGQLLAPVQQLCLTRTADSNGNITTLTPCDDPGDSRSAQIWDYYL